MNKQQLKRLIREEAKNVLREFDSKMGQKDQLAFKFAESQGIRRDEIRVDSFDYPRYVITFLSSDVHKINLAQLRKDGLAPNYASTSRDGLTIQGKIGMGISLS